MARTKKSNKELSEQEPATNNTTLQLAAKEDCLANTPCAVEKLTNFEELLYEQPSAQQMPQIQAQSQLAEHKTQQYQSDSELIALKQKLNLDKNKTNLFLNKSYSFNDKTNVKRIPNLNFKKEHKEFDENHALLLYESGLNINKDEQNVTNKANKSELVEQPQKLPKHKKITKSKSFYDHVEQNVPDVQELQDILRKPLAILEHKVATASSQQRPLSMPASQIAHRTVMKSKTLDDIETPRLKRDSFIRHSLQSIRRSFSSSKKHQHNNQNNNNNNLSCTSNSSASYSSASSSTSSSSAVSDTVKKSSSKAKNCARDIDNLHDVEESNLLITENEVKEVEANANVVNCSLNKANVAVTLNEAQTTAEEQQQQRQHEHEQHSLIKVMPSPSSSSLFTVETLAVLKEEEEKDYNMCLNSSSSSSNNNNNNKNLADVITEQSN